MATDAAFKKPQSKVARGFGNFLFQGDESSVPVKVKIKFTPDGQGLSSSLLELGMPGGT